MAVPFIKNKRRIIHGAASAQASTNPSAEASIQTSQQQIQPQTSSALSQTSAISPSPLCRANSPTAALHVGHDRSNTLEAPTLLVLWSEHSVRTTFFSNWNLAGFRISLCAGPMTALRLDGSRKAYVGKPRVQTGIGFAFSANLLKHLYRRVEVMLGVAYISTKNRMRFALYWNLGFPRIVPANAEIFDRVRNGSVEDVKHLLSSGKASTQDVTVSGTTLLHIASKTTQNTALVRLFIREGGEINAVNEDGETPLHGAMATKSNYDIARLLIENGADLSNRTIDGRTPLHTIFNDTVGQVFMKDNVWIEESMADSLGLSITHYLVWSSQSTVEVLQRCRGYDMVDLQALDTHGRSHIHLAASRGNLDVLNYLLNLAPPSKASEKANEKDHRGCTPLHYMAQTSRAPATMDLLLEKGANMYATDKFGRTALHYTAIWGNIEAAKALIARDKTGKLALLRDRDDNLPSVSASTTKFPLLSEYLERVESVEQAQRKTLSSINGPMIRVFDFLLVLHFMAILLLVTILCWFITRQLS